MFRLLELRPVRVETIVGNDRIMYMQLRFSISLFLFSQMAVSYYHTGVATRTFWQGSQSNPTGKAKLIPMSM